MNELTVINEEALNGLCETKGVWYSHVHHWLKVTYGKANHCDNPLCPKQSTNFNWALRRGFKYEKERDSFMQLCRPCHAKYDLTPSGRERLRLASLGKKFNREGTARRRLEQLGKPFPNTAIAIARSKAACSKPILQIDLGVIVGRFASLRQAAAAVGVTPSALIPAVKGRTKTVKGYEWKYA